MEKEFNLSEWIEAGSWSYKVIPVKNVKEFIKRLKEKPRHYKKLTWKKYLKIIDKLAGDDLNGR